MEWVFDGVINLFLSILTGIENSLGDALANTGMSPNVAASFWAMIIFLCLIVAARLLTGWIRNMVILFIFALVLHIVVTHGIGTVA
jgi:hypothetical protein